MSAVRYVHWIPPTSREQIACSGRTASAFATRVINDVTCQRCQRSAKAFRHHSCVIERRKLVKRGTVNMATGVYTEGSASWEIEPCNAPLFADDERARGVCLSCLGGWRVEDNSPTERGEEQIRAAKVSR